MGTDALQAAEQFAQCFLATDTTGHDWFHIDRVRNMALRLAREEGADAFVVEMAALLHDVADFKLNDGDEQKGLLRVKDFLVAENIPWQSINHILTIIQEVSYKGAGVNTPVSFIESAVVQDADRLDAMGAIGIARMFTYGGAKGRAMYDPSILPANHQDEQAYRNQKSTTFNHFYEKLLLLKDRLNTASASAIAEQRHRFMEEFIEQFLAETKAEL